MEVARQTADWQAKVIYAHRYSILSLHRLAQIAQLVKHNDVEVSCNEFHQNRSRNAGKYEWKVICTNRWSVADNSHETGACSTVCFVKNRNTELYLCNSEKQFNPRCSVTDRRAEGRSLHVIRKESLKRCVIHKSYFLCSFNARQLAVDISVDLTRLE